MKKKNSIKQTIVTKQTSKLNTAQKVKFARDTENTAKASPAYQASPPAQTSMTAWKGATDALDQNRSQITTLEGQLETARTKEVQLVHDYEVAATNYASAVQTVANGDPSVVAALGLGVKPVGTPIVELGAPLGLQIRTSKAGVESLVWDKVLGARVYVMQASVDPATDTSWVTLQAGGRKRKLTTLVHGQKYLLRVKAVGAKLEGPWSAVLGITAK
jgi:hypothetical protein